MFLATTADQRFWNMDEDLLFLGEWCKLYDQKDIWSKLNFGVLPYHWDDRKRLYNDYLYLDSIYERYLENITKNLNELHDVNYSSNYWRIVVGPWLYHFIEILYDRYLSIKSAYQSGLVTNTWICKRNTDLWIPDNFRIFQNWYRSDEYNLYLYSRIIENCHELPFEELDFVLDPPSEIIIPWKNNRLYCAISTMNRIYSILIPSRFNQIVIVNSYMSNLDIVKLQLNLKQFPYLCGSDVFNGGFSSVNSDLRKKIKLGYNGSEFESLLNRLIPEHIPKVFIESYEILHEKSLKNYPKDPKIIFTANAFFDVGFCLWTAYYKEKGAKLIGSQHGGHYGSGLWSVSEDHQIKVCDRYYTWGWKKEGNEKVIPLPTGKFLKLNREFHGNKNGSILWILNSAPRYSYWMFSAATGPHMLNYINDQFNFARSLSNPVFKLLNLRLYQYDFGWDEKNRFKDEFPDLKIINEKDPLYNQLKESRMVISTSNATTFLETFSMDIPTVIFWNPKFWELRPSSEKYFSRLREVGIFHEKPESAAMFVNEIFGDPQSWWNRPEVQMAKNEFCHHFARKSENWVKIWKDEFNRILNE